MDKSIAYIVIFPITILIIGLVLVHRHVCKVWLQLFLTLVVITLTIGFGIIMLRKHLRNFALECFPVFNEHKLDY